MSKNNGNSLVEFRKAMQQKIYNPTTKNWAEFKTA